jgi:hypothetical protein
LQIVNRLLCGHAQHLELHKKRSPAGVAGLRLS